LQIVPGPERRIRSLQRAARRTLFSSWLASLPRMHPAAAGPGARVPHTTATAKRARLAAPGSFAAADMGTRTAS